MTGALYRGAMSLAAAGMGLASALPLAPARWRAWGDRLGRLAPDDRAAATGAPALWLHAASVGELNAARPLAAQLRTRFPGCALVVSTLTRTGLALARTMPEAHVALLLPIDAPGVVARVVDAFRLEAFFFTETEIWPVWLDALASRDVPAFMVSGRVSERTVARARWLRPLYRHALAHVTCCMQTDDDAARIVVLGADPLRVHVAGSLKFDAGAAQASDEVRRLTERVDGAGRRLVVAGSTHEGEEEMLLAAYERIARGQPAAALLLAPRHPERLEAVAATIAARGLACVRYSALVGDAGAPLPPGPLVVLLDVVGPLAQCYTAGTVAFVGGSLVPRGGHNVLEPARAGRPVVVGPHTENARDVVERLVTARAAVRVESEDALAWTLDHLLAHPEEAAAMGRRAQALAREGQGAVERHMKIIAARLTSAHFAREGAP